jgi:predicted branched-subunit amino acid permease
MNQSENVSKGFWAGFRALMPFWLGAVPFAITYVVAARKVGLSPIEIQALSLLVFSAAVQISLVGLLSAGASLWAILFAAVTLTVQNILYGFSLRQKFPLSFLKRLVAAFFLTDGAFALTVAAGESASFAYLLGAELSMFFIWNAGTFAGLLLNQLIVDPASFGFTFAVPLVFLVLIVPMVRARQDLWVLLVAVICAYIGSLILPGGLTIFVTGLVSATFGAWLSTRSRQIKVEPRPETSEAQP